VNTIIVESTDLIQIVCERKGNDQNVVKDEWDLILQQFMVRIYANKEGETLYYVEALENGGIRYSIHLKVPKTKDKFQHLGNFACSDGWIDDLKLTEAGERIYKERVSLGTGEDVDGLTPLHVNLFLVLGYIEQKSKERGRRIVKNGSHRPKYSREHRLSTSKNKIYLLDDIITYASEKYVPESGHSEYTCPCWEVRGHYRHYKNGNVIFIKSYKKGKEKDKAEPISHEYRLERGQK